MNKLAPLTKLLLTLAVTLWAMMLQTPLALSLLILAELLSLALAGKLRSTLAASTGLFVFAVLLGLMQYAFGASLDFSIAIALKMLVMTLIFVLLLATTRLQDLTTALTTQCKVPYEYAFMLTTALRFVPDFLAESKAVREAQACRGYHPGGNPLKRFASYLAVVQPLVLRAITRSETMAVSLELRGFGAPGRTFAGKVSLHVMDYLALAAMIAVSIGIIAFF
nr:energy-coupling factor transporter transmembrane component T [uncultured Anaeromusa sp.]